MSHPFVLRLLEEALDRGAITGEIEDVLTGVRRPVRDLGELAEVLLAAARGGRARPAPRDTSAPPRR